MPPGYYISRLQREEIEDALTNSPSAPQVVQRPTQTKVCATCGQV